MPESKSGALDQLGDAPSENQSLLVSKVVQRVTLQPPRDEAPHGRRQFLVQGFRILLPRKFAEHAGARSRHARPWTAFSQPRKMLRDFGISAHRDGLEIIAALTRQKGRYFERFRIPCQRRV